MLLHPTIRIAPDPPTWPGFRKTYVSAMVGFTGTGTRGS